MCLQISSSALPDDFGQFEGGTPLEEAMSIDGSSMDISSRGVTVHLPIPGTGIMVSGGTRPSAEESAEKALAFRELLRKC
jgi:hypothetical protein